VSKPQAPQAEGSTVPEDGFLSPHLDYAVVEIG
jgi:hypothetical protein